MLKECFESEFERRQPKKDIESWSRYAARFVNAFNKASTTAIISSYWNFQHKEDS
mgnify:CR=1 FL=1